MTTIDQAMQLGLRAHERGELDKAMAIYQSITAQAPSGHPLCSAAWANIARLHERHNRTDEAERAAAKALQHQPLHPVAGLVRARCLRRRGQLEASLQQLRAIPEGPNLAENLFEQGQVLDRLSRYREAYPVFVEANRLQTASAPGVRRDLLPRLLTKIHQTCARHPIAAWTPSPRSTRPAPLFMVGFNRSGTTLLDRMLDAHPQVRILEEVAGIDAAQRALGAAYPEQLPLLTPEMTERSRAAYFSVVDRHIPRDFPGLRIDKLPLNTLSLALIYRLFPDARVVVSLRHPADVVLSNFMQPYGTNPITIHFDSIASAAELYGRVMTLGIFFQRRLPLRFLSIRYEDLIQDWERELRRLLAFANLPWDPALRQYREQARRGPHIKTPSYADVVQPVYRRAEGRWKHYESELAPTLPSLFPFIRRFGYAE